MSKEVAEFVFGRDRAALPGWARAVFVVLVVSMTVATSARTALGAEKDAAALKLAGDAMGNDYLDTSFVKAEKKLRRAIGLCKKGGCSPKVVALLHRDLAVVNIGGLDKLEEGQDEIAQALDADPTIQMDEDLATAEFRKAWEEQTRRREAKKSHHGGDITHEPVAAQTVGVPIPIYATLSEGIVVKKLRVRYRRAGKKKWISVAMTKKDDGYVAEIPCSAVGKKGAVEYYVQALDLEGEVLLESGSASEPYSVRLRKHLEGDPPHLPGAEPPAACAKQCAEGDDCEEDKPASETGALQNWFSLSIQQDFAISGGTADACSASNQINGSIACYRAQGSQYHGTPLTARDDTFGGGVGVATTRILIGFDRILGENLSAGIRLGYVLRGGGPRPDGADSTAFLPAHGEIRVAYWFGDKVFSTAGFRPFVYVDGGLAEVDSHQTTIVFEDTSKAPPISQLDNPRVQRLDVYRRMGQGFAGGGLGAMVAFTPAIGAVLDVKVMELFPALGTVVSPTVAMAFGF